MLPQLIFKCVYKNQIYLLPIFTCGQQYRTLPANLFTQEEQPQGNPPYYVEIYKTNTQVYSQPYNPNAIPANHKPDSYLPIPETAEDVTKAKTGNLATDPTAVTSVDYYNLLKQDESYPQGQYQPYYGTGDEQINGNPTGYYSLPNAAVVAPQPDFAPVFREDFQSDPQSGFIVNAQTIKPRKKSAFKKSKIPKKYHSELRLKKAKLPKLVKAVQPVDEADEYSLLDTDKLKRRIPLSFNADSFNTNQKFTAEYKNPFVSDLNSFNANIGNHHESFSSHGERMEFQMFGMDGPHSYKFGYDTGKGPHRHFRYEERDNEGKIRGHYGFMDQEGKMSMIKYEADPHTGFHASPYEHPENYR